MKPYGYTVPEYRHPRSDQSVRPERSAIRANLYSSDCHSRRSIQLLQGAYYPSFGKPRRPASFGPEMITRSRLDSPSASRPTTRPTSFRGLSRHVSSRATCSRPADQSRPARVSQLVPKAIEQPDFLWSEDNWFRPSTSARSDDGALTSPISTTGSSAAFEVPLTHPRARS